VRLQSGFNCGLVALRMGAEFITPTTAITTSIAEKHENVHTTSLLALAIELGFTNEGEIFSSYDLGTLAQRYYGLKVDVKSHFTSKDIVAHLSLGYPLLLPYDADKSYAPCVLNGQRPHWAIIRGFIVRTADTSSLEPQQEYEVDEEDEFFLHTKSSSSSPIGNQIEYNDESLYLICQHGKSKNIALWSFTAVQQSNSNLKVPNESKKESGRWKIPDTLCNLQNHIIFLYPP